MHYRVRPSSGMKQAKWRSFYSYFFQLHGNDLTSAVENHRWVTISPKRLSRLMKKLERFGSKRRSLTL